MVLALENYFANPKIDVLVDLFAAINAMGMMMVMMMPMVIS